MRRALFGVLLVIGLPALAQPPVFQELRTLTIGLKGFSQIGSAVAVDDDLLLLGAPDLNGSEDGPTQVVVFSRNAGGHQAWGFADRLIANDTLVDDGFGGALAIDGRTIVVGASTHPGGKSGQEQGAVYVFQETVPFSGVWKEQQKLVGSNATNLDRFGTSVSLWRDTLVVGAPGQFGTSGKAYIFERSPGGPFHETVALATPIGHLGFGEAVDVEGGDAYVGADLASVPGQAFAGTVSWFQRQSNGAWSLVQTLDAPDPEAFAGFGSALDFQSDRGLVGAPDVEPTGAVYAYERVNGVWSLGQTITSDSEEYPRRFGRAVRLDGDTAVIGDKDDSTFNFFGGRLFAYRWSEGTWELEQGIGPQGDPFIQEYGITAAIQGGTVVIGDPSAALTLPFFSGLGWVLESTVVGAVVPHAHPTEYTCRNLATGETATGPVLRNARSVRCADLGVSAQPGDRVQIDLDAVAIGVSSSSDLLELRGSATAMSLEEVRCTNLETAVGLSIPLDANTTWDCVEAGLAITKGDAIRLSIVGEVDWVAN